MNIKGKIMKYPFKLQYNNFHLECGRGILGPKQMMMVDIIGTQLIHQVYGNMDFFGRIPRNTEKLVKERSGLCMSTKLLKYVVAHLPNDGVIPEVWYTDERLSHVDKSYARLKRPLTIILNDGTLRKELPFLQKYSSKKIWIMIYQAFECLLWMNYPICFHDGKKYNLFPFNNYGYTSSLFTLEKVNIVRVSKNNKVLEREYHIRFDTILGFAFMQNMISCYTDFLPGKFYELSDYAQLYYRLFILSYYPIKKIGKIPKNPLSIDEIRQRLVLSTKDTFMVRKVVRRIMEELTANDFIKHFKEEKKDGKYFYRYSKNSWKEITGEANTSEVDLDYIGN